MIDNMLEVKLNKDEDFLKIKETLERIGISNKEQDTIYQTAHILHKSGRYYITHFKEMFLLDGRTADFSEEDKGRRNTIASLLEDWELLKIVDRKKLTPLANMSKIKVVKFSERDKWTFQPKYTIGKKFT